MSSTILENQRTLHEDLERLEQAITERIGENPRNIKDRLTRDHQVSGFLTRVQDQSQRLLDIYRDRDGSLAKEKAMLSGAASSDPFQDFYAQYESIKDFHRRYPGEQVENLERAYKRRRYDDEDSGAVVNEVDNMFTGEESNGRFLDLVALHEEYLNLNGIRRLTYLQYLDHLDAFEAPRMPIRREKKVTDQYLQYVGNLASYLEGFIRRTRPLENLSEQFRKIEREFELDWEAGKVPGWPKINTTDTSDLSTERIEMPIREGIWCSACEKSFTNQNVYDAHLKGKKHIKAAAAAKSPSTDDTTQPTPATSLPAQVTGSATSRELKERLIASHEHRIRSLCQLLTNERSNTRVNVERKQGMTDRERAAELEALFREDDDAVRASATSHSRNPDNSDGEGNPDDDDSEDEKIYNPLKLPLAWDGKPIPYWLYKLHGLGVEFTCEICGNFVYMGRRAFDKHFSEARHVYGLKCLGITGSGLGGSGGGYGGLSMFREITGIEEARGLWAKLVEERGRREKEGGEVVQMEDGEGNVMPERVWKDLVKQGIL